MTNSVEGASISEGDHKELTPEELLEKIPSAQELENLIDYFQGKGMQTKDIEDVLIARKKLEEKISSQQ